MHSLKVSKAVTLQARVGPVTSITEGRTSAGPYAVIELLIGLRLLIAHEVQSVQCGPCHIFGPVWHSSGHWQRYRWRVWHLLHPAPQSEASADLKSKSDIHSCCMLGIDALHQSLLETWAAQQWALAAVCMAYGIFCTLHIKRPGSVDARWKPDKHEQCVWPIMYSTTWHSHCPVDTALKPKMWNWGTRPIHQPSRRPPQAMAFRHLGTHTTEH